jgi:hypothetical protein
MHNTVLQGRIDRIRAAKESMPTIGGVFAKGVGQADASQN